MAIGIEESSNVRNVEDPSTPPMAIGVGRDDETIQKYFYTSLLYRFRCFNNPNIDFLPTVFIEEPHGY